MVSAENKSLSPPIQDNEIEKLLVPHEDIRDPVHRDIRITALERAIIDTGAFQRLRSLSQLGPTHLVYPGAVHTRFIHSLGTLHCAEELVRVANYNHSTYSQPSLIKVDPYPHFLVRLCALLHDVAHIPFGHTLEDEGNIAPSQWKDAERAKYWLGKEGEIPIKILEFLGDSGISSSVAEQVVNDIRQYVLFEGDPMDLDYPFVIDLVGNTLCADLLDYVERDMYFCGLRERSGDRVVKYIAIVRVRDTKKGLRNKNNSDSRMFLPSTEAAVGRGRAVLLTYRFEREHLAGGGLKLVPQPKILSEAIDLLRRRYALAEKVYFHRTKLAASAMLISAMGSATLDYRKTYNFSDSGLLSELRSDPNPRTQHIVAAYGTRRLYKPVYRLNYREERDADPPSKDLWKNKYPDFRDPAWRKDKEEYLETYSGLPPGSIVIYCPDRTMSLKEFEMLVQSQPNEEVKPLEKILDSHRRLEMDSINRPFAQLWSLIISVDPKVIDSSQFANEAVQNLSALCESVIGFPNDIMELQSKGRPLREQLANRVIQEWQQEAHAQVPHDVFRELVQAPHRGEGSNLIEAMRNHLRAKMKPKQLELDTRQKKK